MAERRAARIALGAAGTVAAATATAAATAAVGTKIAAGRLRRRAVDGSVLDPVDLDRVHVETDDGAELSVVRTGSGPPILLSHGVTLSLRTWVKQLRALPAAGFEAVAYDQRGHGSSSVGLHGRGNGAVGADLVALLEQLDLRDAVVVGHSMGGIAAMVAALEYPEVVAQRVRGIVLVSTLARVPYGSHATRLKQRVERTTDRTPDATRVWRSPDVGVLLARLGFGDGPDWAHLELTRLMLAECSPHTRLESPRALIGTDLAERLHEIRIPTLVLCGTRDLVTPLSNSEVLARHIPGARLEVFEGGGHMLMLEDADRLNRLVVDFATQVTGRRSGPCDPSDGSR